MPRATSTTRCCTTKSEAPLSGALLEPVVAVAYGTLVPVDGGQKKGSSGSDGKEQYRVPLPMSSLHAELHHGTCSMTATWRHSATLMQVTDSFDQKGRPLRSASPGGSIPKLLAELVKHAPAMKFSWVCL